MLIEIVEKLNEMDGTNKPIDFDINEIFKIDSGTFYYLDNLKSELGLEKEPDEFIIKGIEQGLENFFIDLSDKYGEKAAYPLQIDASDLPYVELNEWYVMDKDGNEMPADDKAIKFSINKLKKADYDYETYWDAVVFTFTP